MQPTTQETDGPPHGDAAAAEPAASDANGAQDAASATNVDGTIARARAVRPAWFRRALLLGLVFCLPLLSVVAAFGLDRALSRDRVLRGVWAGQLSLSGLDAAGLERALTGLEARLRQTPVRLRARRELFAVLPAELDYRLDKPAVAQAAMRAGREGGVIDQFRFWWSGFSLHRRVAVTGRLGAGSGRVLSDIEHRAVPDAPFEGGISVRDGRVRAEPPRPGQSLARPAALAAILDAVNQRRTTVVDLPVRTIEPRVSPADMEAARQRAERLVARPVELVAPDGVRIRFEPSELGAALRSRTTDDGQIDLYFSHEILQRKLDPLRPEIETVAQSATYAVDHQDRLILVPSRHARSLSVPLVAEALVEAAASPARTGPLPLPRGEAPSLTTEELLSLGIKHRVASFTTRHACCQPRVKNIHRIADLLDGIVLKPGERLSVNERVGPRTESNGFVPAPSIEDGEMVDTVGGGISQFATTLFNAALHGGYEMIARAPHSYYFSRYPMGHEATLSYPQPDLVFGNDSQAGLLIKTSYTERSITVTLYGDNGGRVVQTKVSPQFDVVEPPIEYVPNPELDPEEERSLSKGQVGWSVLATRIVTYPDGTTKHEDRKVIYKPRPASVEVHPCRIPKGEPGHTGETCPEPEVEDAGAAPPELLETSATEDLE
ncbi:MAG TPA: VanW family protein [Polyangiaceae bacterium]|nr:VanW family protein [Polyangiaceae bacterium]